MQGYTHSHPGRWKVQVVRVASTFAVSIDAVSVLKMAGYAPHHQYPPTGVPDGSIPQQNAYQQHPQSGYQQQPYGGYAPGPQGAGMHVDAQYQQSYGQPYMGYAQPPGYGAPVPNQMGQVSQADLWAAS